MKHLRKLSLAVVCLFIFCAVMSVVSSAQVFTNLASFTSTTGSSVDDTLVQGANGQLYGTTYYGGAYGYGTVFEVTTGGTITLLYNFTGGKDGANPYFGLVLATDGNFYGSTYSGGDLSCYPPYGCGTIFKITPAGKLTTLHIFEGVDGQAPSRLVQATNGKLFGTTRCLAAGGYGSVFQITTGGTLTTLYTFTAGTDGYCPLNPLVQATGGKLYGTTNGAGLYGYGTVFKISTSGALTTLHAFDNAEGGGPGPLIQGIDGNFYGMNQDGGAQGDGMVYKITTGGTLTILYSFCSRTFCVDGRYPTNGLVQGTDGNFYGPVTQGGATLACGAPYGCGTLFEITSGGFLTTWYEFNGTDGQDPFGGLIQATNGKFYGTTSGGGAYGGGTFFSFDMGLGPFVETNPTSGSVGTSVVILGYKLTGTTGVSFNGTAAAYSVVSDTAITATVPALATTGTVTVETPSGTLSSNIAFRVTP